MYYSGHWPCVLYAPQKSGPVVTNQLCESSSHLTSAPALEERYSKLR